jgi:hypothetical protein
VTVSVAGVPDTGVIVTVHVPAAFATSVKPICAVPFENDPVGVSCVVRSDGAGVALKHAGVVDDVATR